MLLKGTNSSAMKEKDFLLVINAGGEPQRKTLLTDGSGRASFELDTSGWNDEVFLHVSDPCPTPWIWYSSRRFPYTKPSSLPLTPTRSFCTHSTLC